VNEHWLELLRLDELEEPFRDKALDGDVASGVAGQDSRAVFLLSKKIPGEGVARREQIGGSMMLSFFFELRIKAGSPCACAQ
jgi:hypothetical protein